jgi:hypothetical protein
MATTAYRLPPLVPLTVETGFGSWPTPDASAANINEPVEKWTTRRRQLKDKHNNGNGCGMPLGIAVRMWPTPTSRDWKDGSARSCANVPVNALLGRAVHWATPSICGNYNRKGASATSGDGLATQVGGALNPTWVEWLMGFPLAWTALDASATPSCRKSRK